MGAHSMIAAGIDFSTHAVDIVTTDGLWQHFKLDGDSAFDRLRSVPLMLPDEDWWTYVGVVAVAIEEPQGGVRSAVAKLKATQGAIVATLPPFLLVQPMMPSEWRKAVGLPGNAGKGDVSRHVHHQRHLTELGDRLVGTTLIDFWPQDACDAYCLALAIRSRLREGTPA